MNTSAYPKSRGKIRTGIVFILLTVSIVASSSVPIAYVKAEYRQTVCNNEFNTTMMLSEVGNDAGADFSETKNDHAAIVTTYAEHMSAQNVSWYLRVYNFFHPGLDPKKQLSTVIETLNRDVKDDAEAEQRIKDVAKIIDDYRDKLNNYCGQKVIRATPQETLEGFSVKIRNSFDNAHDKVEQFLKSPTVDNSEKACRAHRVAITNFYLVRFAYQDYIDWDSILQFRGDMNRMIHYDRLLEKDVSKEGEKTRLDRYSKSELHRLETLQFIIEGKYLESHNSLLASVKTAKD